MNTRQQAMKWWYNMEHWQHIFYMQGDFEKRDPQTLTGREIEIIFKNKCNEITTDAIKNQEKQN